MFSDYESHLLEFTNYSLTNKYLKIIEILFCTLSTPIFLSFVLFYYNYFKFSYRVVIETLEEVSPKRKCFRMIGGVLVEKTVEEILPALVHNRNQVNLFQVTIIIIILYTIYIYGRTCNPIASTLLGTKKL